MKNKRIYANYLKRPVDFILAFLAIAILSPIFLILSVLIKLKLGSPIIFKQQRPGLNGKIFTMYKFRTMSNSKDEAGNMHPDEIRLTKFGKILRSTSLDELPELWNILVGDMSIVGPRPLLVQYLPLYNEHQKKRHAVRPGLTGWAQVNGRNTITWDKKFELDVEYVNKINFITDLKIVFLTLRKVIKREDINSTTDITMDLFKGNLK